MANNKNVMILALIFGIVTFLITTVYLGNVSKDQKYKSALIPVIVAKTNVPARTILNKEMVEIKQIPREYVLPGATSIIADIQDKVTLTPLIPGEQLTASKITARNRQLGLALIIPKDKRAVSVEVDSSASIAGLVKPGDMVDVLCTLQELDRTVTILQNVPVLAIDQQMETNNNTNAKMNRTVVATFALGLHDSEKLVQASFKGQLKLLLRSINDAHIESSWGANTNQLLPYQPAGKSSPVYSIQVIRGSDVTNKKM